MAKWDNDKGSEETLESWTFFFQRHIGSWMISVVALAAFLSPILMVALPHLDVMPFRDSQLRCDVRSASQNLQEFANCNSLQFSGGMRWPPH